MAGIRGMEAVGAGRCGGGTLSKVELPESSLHRFDVDVVAEVLEHATYVHWLRVRSNQNESPFRSDYIQTTSRQHVVIATWKRKALI